MVGYNKDPSKMRDRLARREGYAKYFKVVPAKMVQEDLKQNYDRRDGYSEDTGSGATYIRTVSELLPLYRALITLKL
jgi:hypothetical protein